MSHPVFAVVGRVNKGKSSIIATLAEDPQVAISPTPGTTRRLTRFPVQVDGETLFELVDTPGFEEASRALHWLRAEDVTADARPARVAALLAAFADGDDLRDERTLLAPILEGAFVIYVVDGSRPFRPNYEDEMEILRWTGRPGMALINRIAAGDHAAAWRPALQQYFSVVRDFDAHRATFDQRVGLLRAFRELDAGLAPALDRAVRALVDERARRRAEVTTLLTDLVIDAVTLTREARAERKDALAKEALEADFHAALRAREQAARSAVAALYKHPAAWAEGELDRPVLDEDLFAERTWKGLGLTPGQLIAAATAAGATTGGAIDVAVGGASFMVGALVGGALGAAGGWAQSMAKRVAQATHVKDVLQGDDRRPRFRVGPHQNPNFPFVLLDRALLHYDAVLSRTHARQDAATVEGRGRGPTANLDRGARAALTRAFGDARRDFADPPRAAREVIHQHIAALVEATDRAAGGTPS